MQNAEGTDCAPQNNVSFDFSFIELDDNDNGVVIM